MKVPEAFSRRYESMRSANDAIGVGSVVAMLVLYGVGGIGIGLFFMLRRRWVIWRQRRLVGRRRRPDCRCWRRSTSGRCCG